MRYKVQSALNLGTKARWSMVVGMQSVFDRVLLLSQEGNASPHGKLLSIISLGCLNNSKLGLLNLVSTRQVIALFFHRLWYYYFNNYALQKLMWHECGLDYEQSVELTSLQFINKHISVLAFPRTKAAFPAKVAQFGLPILVIRALSIVSRPAALIVCPKHLVAKRFSFPLAVVKNCIWSGYTADFVVK